VPLAWDGPHVGLRLTEAFGTLAFMPGLRLRQPSGYWPAYEYEWEDLLAQRASDAASIEDAANQRNRTRIQPSAQEISRMETALCWAGRYIAGNDTETAQIVQATAYAYASERDSAYVARRLRIGQERVRIKNRDGLERIAAGLRRHGVRVF
jgi:hypothetical protein